jgi:hypothetical protein
MKNTGWETYKRRQIMSYSKRKNRNVLIIVLIALAILFYLFCGNHNPLLVY